MTATNRNRLFVAFGLLLCCLTLIGCDPDTSALATLTPTFLVIPPTATVAPIAPTANNIDSSNVSVDAFTRAAPPTAGGSNGETVTPTLAPTQASIDMSFVTSDGLSIAATYYAAPSRPSPVVLLLHMEGHTKESWRPFAIPLQASWYSVLAVDLRGSGETGGSVDWGKAPADISDLLKQIRNLPGVDSTQITLIGAGVGANLAIRACADSQACKSVVLISPALNILGVGAFEPLSRYTGPLLIVASRDDQPSDSATLDKAAKGNHTLQLYPGNVRGTDLFVSQSALTGFIIQWLATH